jgi:r-opsin
MANLTGDVVAMAQKQSFDPWALPDSFTLYAYAPEEIRSFLHPHWHSMKAIHPMWYYMMGLFYLVIGVIALCGNFIVLRIFSNFPALRTPANMLVMNLAVSDFLLMLTLIPECTYNFFLGGPWRFGDMGCQIHAFAGSLFGYNQIFTLTMISYDRYNVIVKGFSGTPLTFSRATTFILFSWIWALGWATAPLVGWGGYAMDGIMGTCSYDYVTRTMNNKSAILTLFCANFVVPVTTIAGCYYFIVHAVFKHEEELRAQAKKMNVASLRSNADNQQVSAEIRIAKVSIMNVTLWLSAWTPFAVICMIGTWGDVSKITPLVSAIPVILAKTSCAYNPIIYAISHPKYRECLKEMMPWMCIVVDNKKAIAEETNSVNSTETIITEKSEKA